MKASAGLGGRLETELIRAPRLHRVKTWRTPFGRFGFTRDPGEGNMFASGDLTTNLSAVHMRNGKVYDRYDLGSGLVTQVGTLAMINDYQWSASLNLSTLGTQNFHATGTGATAAAQTDFKMQTLGAPTTTTAVTGAQTAPAITNLGTNSQIYQNVATVNYTSSLAITEWGLHSLATLSSTTGTPFTAATATTWTDTGSAQTASSATVRGLQQTIVVPGTTTVWGLNLSNTTHIGTIFGWYTQAAGAAGSTPGATEAFSIKPVLWDHKVFSAINVNNLDSIIFTYQLTTQSGG